MGDRRYCHHAERARVTRAEDEDGANTREVDLGIGGACEGLWGTRTMSERAEQVLGCGITAGNGHMRPGVVEVKRG